MQSHRMSLVEAATNVVSGVTLSLAYQTVAFPLEGCYLTFAGQLRLTAGFTLLSFARSYVIRRFFVWLWKKGLK